MKKNLSIIIIGLIIMFSFIIVPNAETSTNYCEYVYKSCNANEDIGCPVDEHETFIVYDNNGTAAIKASSSSANKASFNLVKINNDDFYELGKFTSCAKTLNSVYNGKINNIDSYSIGEKPGFFSSVTTVVFSRTSTAPKSTTKEAVTSYSQATCEGILGTFKDDLVNIFKIIKIAGPILVFVYSAWDFLSAIFMKDDAQLKKASSKLVKRLILIAVLFFLPTILNVLLGIINASYISCVV